MRTFAQKSKQPGPAPQLQHMVENRVGKPALKAESGGASAAAATPSFAHDFSRTPVHAPEPITASDKMDASGDVAVNQADCPPGKIHVPPWLFGHRVVPEVKAKWEPPKRVPDGFLQNSTTTPGIAPTLTGHLAADCKAKVWRYQLTSFSSGGTIQIFWKSKDHYPAPGPPEDDTAALTNVNKGNWKEIVDYLEAHKDAGEGKWSAYMGQELHERYHWEVEWTGLVKKLVFELENKLAKLQVPFTSPYFPFPPIAAEAAEASLEARMNTELAAAYHAAEDAFGGIPDTPKSGPEKPESDPAYIAQIPAFTYLINRVKAYAMTKGWTSASPRKDDKKGTPSGK